MLKKSIDKRQGPAHVDVDEYKPQSSVENGCKIFNNPCRVLIAGVSGSGKTSIVLNMIFSDDPDYCLRFTKLYVCAKDLGEPAYRCLRAKMEEITNFMNQKLEESGQAGDIQIYHEVDDVHKLSVDDLDPNEANCIIMDDMVLELQDAKSRKAMSSFYQRARKKNATMIYLTQNVFHDGLKFIRMQCNEIWLFNLGSLGNIRRLSSELGINFDELSYKYNQATSKKFGFVRIQIDDKKIHVGL
jgi:hypothetical protein